MKKLLLLFAALTIMFSCSKEMNDEIIEFSLKISSFTIETSTFKSTSVDYFSEFTHSYPINSSIAFINDEGVRYVFYTGDLTLETFKFGLPLGTYHVTGNGGTTAETSDLMMFSILDQSIVVTPETISIPITLNPNCFLILVADPEQLIDETNPPRIRNWWSVRISPLFQFDDVLRYIYAIPASKSELTITKLNNSQLICSPTSNFFKNGYTYKILINSASDTTILNPIFVETEQINF